MTFSSARLNSENDFALTYAARTTAGFSVAFSPANYASVSNAFAAARPGEASPAAGGSPRSTCASTSLRSLRSNRTTRG